MLKQVFKELDETPKAEKCPAIEGIKKEHDDFVSDHDASPDITDLFLTGSGARAEHYEIAAYSGLITMATALGEKEAVKLLEAEPQGGAGGTRGARAGRQPARQGGGNGAPDHASTGPLRCCATALRRALRTAGSARG